LVANLQTGQPHHLGELFQFTLPGTLRDYDRSRHSL
jgi:hypothetical protein